MLESLLIAQVVAKGPDTVQDPGMGYLLSCGNRLVVPDVYVHGDTMGGNNTLSGGHPNPSERILCYE